jgi:FeS assembly SUF system protein
MTDSPFLPMIQPTSSEGAAPSPAGSRTADLVADETATNELKPRILDAVRTVFDPEIPVNIYELGLIYDIFVTAEHVVGVRMTLTSPSCPAAQTLPGDVERKVRGVEGVADARVDVVFEPPWDKDRMSEAAKLQLGLW